MFSARYLYAFPTAKSFRRRHSHSGPLTKYGRVNDENQHETKQTAPLSDLEPLSFKTKLALDYDNK